MSEVFVSYARSSEPQAALIADALRGVGYGVWRDDELPAHRSYADVIEERLKAAKAVVVIWTADAAKSQWVRAEAETARGAGKLVQVRSDETMPPLPFNQIQCADLNGWSGEQDHLGWRKVLSSVAALAGERSPVLVAPVLHRSICVLPFANMSGDAEQEYFSDGISEDITTDLSQISSIEVIARNTAFTFKGQSVDVGAVARKLGVSHVLEGSVRKAGNRVRISAQLIDGATGGHLWAERFDRDLDDIFAIQDEISKAIVAALKVKLLPGERKAIEQRGTNSAEAYNLYLMARQFWVAGNHGDCRREERVVRLCQQATKIDPHYARAWALMALAEANLQFGYEVGTHDALASAERALAIDPAIAEAHCVKARHLAQSGLFEEADAEIAAGLRLDPESWEVNKEAARLYLRQRRIDAAARHFEKAVAVMESDFHAWALLVTCYQAQGNQEGVAHGGKMMIQQAEAALAHDPSNGAALGIGAGGLAILGQAERAKEWIERALLIDPDNLNMRYNFACVLAGYLNDPEASMNLLETALGKGSFLELARTDPDFDSLRDNPRFQAMLSEASARLAAAKRAS